MRLETAVSPVMLKSHVEIIYSRLSEAPKLFSTERIPVKPVSVILSYAMLTFYVVEYDPRRRLAFGYMEDKHSCDLSQWGHVEIDELIKIGFEMDIYNSDMKMIVCTPRSQKELYHG